jgi:hypothetical protein
MKIAFLTGLVAAVLCGYLHFAVLTGIAGIGGFLYYSPLLIYFASIYFSMKRNATVNHGGQIEFKQAIKYGGITALIVCIGILIGFYVGLTHFDVIGQYKSNVAEGMSKEDISFILKSYTGPVMFDRAKYFTFPYFLLGFIVTVGCAFVIKLFQAKRKSG